MGFFSSNKNQTRNPQRRPSFNKRAESASSRQKESELSTQGLHTQVQTEHQKETYVEDKPALSARVPQQVNGSDRPLRRRPSGSVKVAHVPGTKRQPRNVSGVHTSESRNANERPQHEPTSQSSVVGSSREGGLAPQELSSYESSSVRKQLSAPHASSQEGAATERLTMRVKLPHLQMAKGTQKSPAQAEDMQPLDNVGQVPQNEADSKKPKRRPSINAKIKEDKLRQAHMKAHPQDRYRAQSPKSDGLSVRMEEKFFGSKDSAEVPADNAVKDAFKSGAERLRETIRSLTSSVTPDKAREGAQGAVHGLVVVCALVLQWLVAFLKRRGKALAIGGGIFLLIFFSAYFPAKEYYLVYRANQRAQNELQANIEHNAALKNEISHLQTQEGVEDFARENLGMIKPDENSLRLLGATAQDQPDSSGHFTSKRIEKDSGTAPVSWKTKFLDFFFGVGDTSKSPNHRD